MNILAYWKAHLRLLIILLLAFGLIFVTQAKASEQTQDDASIDSLLAPVALYPDTLLSHILIAASYPLEVVQASRWQKRHQHLDPTDIIDAAEEQDWDPSVKALLPFEDILTRMSEDLEWTQALGEFFVADEERVLARIQVLRQHAYKAGNLSSNSNVKVESDAEVIRIETVRREVVYVPYYDTRVVYGDWWWAHHRPHYWHHPYSYATVNIVWGPRIHVRPYFYFSNFHWHNHYVVVNRPYFYQRPKHYSRQTLIIRDGKRWQHQYKHRRGVRYDNPVVHRKVTDRQTSLSREVAPRHRVEGKIASKVVRSSESANHHKALRDSLHKQSRAEHARSSSSESGQSQRARTTESPSARTDVLRHSRKESTGVQNRQGRSQATPQPKKVTNNHAGARSTGHKQVIRHARDSHGTSYKRADSLSTKHVRNTGSHRDKDTGRIQRR
ncbi:DUF3300 domain-containing protein [Lacimicrobium sp. SS2-24]|uniref:DUF3300 domain-containing protein n=1 Tax=Lacimicrobium sp. SS2-24 TaxID=2005569 RepID=UPI00143BA2C5|nr:DUF3300 domain-containing protein [Lacimicrobium sp. SS2-24]